MDILDYCPRDLRTFELQDILMKSSKELNNLTHPPSEDTLLLPSNNILYVSQETTSTFTRAFSSHARKVLKFIKKIWHHNFINDSNWAEKLRGNLLVTATLIATISFQAGLNPPGGVWQDSNNGHNIPGTSIFASRDFDSYVLFYAWDTLALISSSGIILLMISGFPLNSKLFMALLMLAMTATISFTLNIYAISMSVFTSEDLTKDQLHTLGSIDKFAQVSWGCVYYLVILFYLVRFIAWFLAKRARILKAGSSLIKYIRTRVCVSSPSNSTVI